MDEDQVVVELMEKVRRLEETVKTLEVAFAKHLDLFNRHIADLHVGHR